MTSFSDPFLSSLNTWLQWIAIIGTSFGLLSAVGLFFVTSELSSRQEKRLAAAQQDASNAHKLADSVQTRLQPRAVTQEQRAKFLAAVKDIPKGKLSVYSFMNADPGTIQYANQIRDMIVAAGFESGVMVGMSMGGGPIPVGAAIAVKDDASQPPFAGPVQRALSDAGIPLSGIVDPSLPADEVKIIVGLKPDSQ
jgi:hypothetical protein